MFDELLGFVLIVAGAIAIMLFGAYIPGSFVDRIHRFGLDEYSTNLCSGNDGVEIVTLDTTEYTIYCKNGAVFEGYLSDIFKGD